MANPTAEIVGTPIRYELDGVADDLLTAGLGVEGLRGPAPMFADPLKPTPRELRRRAIYMSYRGLADVTQAGGYGSLFGAGGRVPGVEYVFAIRTPDGRATTTGMLQIPRGFDVANPCVIAVASSGSRGIYGALPTAGEWGLRNHCAVIHTDKGTGAGIFDVDSGRGIRIDGTLGEAGDPLLTYSPSSTKNRPHAVMFKHASSGLNIEAHWGEYLLQAIDAGFQLLNRELPGRGFSPAKTLVIASGISNGGATVLRALERDQAGWIDGAVVSEPNVMVPDAARGLAIESGGRKYEQIGRPLFDHGTEHLVFQPCAVLAEAEMSVAARNGIAAVRGSLEQWCKELHAADILKSTTLAAQAAEGRQRLLDYGILPEALSMGYANVVFSVWSAVGATYSAAYAKAAPDEFPCGISFAATDTSGTPRALTSDELARAFADNSGIAPTAGISMIAPDASGQLRAVNLMNAQLAMCLRSLHTVQTNPFAQRIAEGHREAAMSARVGQRPVIILHGRADGLIPVNHASRAYYAVNQRDDGARSELRYYEVEHGQHFDAFLPLPDFAASLVPLQPHLLEAMNLMAARLRRNAALPPSQVVRSRPRGSASTPLAAEHLGALRDQPGADAITFDARTLRVPQ